MIQPEGRTTCGFRRIFADDMTTRRNRALVMLAVLLVLSASAARAGGPYPPYPTYPPPAAPTPYARGYPAPPPRVVAPPPPLSPAMRVVYAPFYAAGLAIRYGFYYVVVAPLEVFGRALGYGVEGGVERPEADR
jgi:hypothetical protein